MPEAWNGIGTKYYGARDWKSDRSHVTTEWFVFIHFPLVPLGSYRVREVEHVNLGLGYSTRYETQRVPLAVAQVLGTYAFAVILVLPLFSLMFVPIHEWNKGTALGVTAGAILGWPLLCFLALFLIRRRTASTPAPRPSLEECTRALERSPADPDAYVARAIARLDGRDVPGAIEDCESALRVAKLNWPGWTATKELLDSLRRDS